MRLSVDVEPILSLVIIFLEFSLNSHYSTADQRDGTRSRTDRIPPSCVAQGPSREAPVACVLLLVLVQLPLASRAYTPCRSARTGLGTGLATVIAGLLYRPRRPRFPTRPALPGSHHGERGHGHAFLWS